MDSLTTNRSLKMSDVQLPTPTSQVGTMGIDLTSLFVEMMEEAIEQLDDTSDPDDIINQITSIVDR